MIGSEIELTAVVPDDSFTVTQAVNALGFGKFQILVITQLQRHIHILDFSLIKGNLFEICSELWTCQASEIVKLMFLVKIQENNNMES